MSDEWNARRIALAAETISGAADRMIHAAEMFERAIDRATQSTDALATALDDHARAQPVPPIAGLESPTKPTKIYHVHIAHGQWATIGWPVEELPNGSIRVDAPDGPRTVIQGEWRVAVLPDQTKLWGA